MRGGDYLSDDDERAALYAGHLAALRVVTLASVTFLTLQAGCTSFATNHEILQVEGQQRLGDGSHLVAQALHQYRKGHLEQAISKFDQALAIDPDNGIAHNNLGLIYYQQRQLVPAANHFDAASELLPEDPRPISNLGMTLEGGGRVMEAIDLYAEASRLAPDNPQYLGNWLRARVRLGERSDDLIEQLEYLAFIETRPDWLSWVDEQLALHRNPVLDRGPTSNTDSARRIGGNGLNATDSNSSRELPSGGRFDERVDEEQSPASPPSSRELAPSDMWMDDVEHLPVPAPVPPSNHLAPPR